MAAPSAPLVDGSGGRAGKVDLEESVFAADVRPHLVHEAVRAELAARRAGTRAVKTRGLVSGGRSKPWRQKGTGRARAGSSRASHWTGGGVAFEPRTSFGLKVNRKAARAALRAALASHAQSGTIVILDVAAFDGPETRRAATVVESAELELPLVVVANEDEAAITKSFRNLARTVVVTPDELEVSAVVWARSLLVTEAALPFVERRAGVTKEGESS